MEWVSVRDRLPPVCEWVIVKALKIKAIEGPNVFVACRGKNAIDDEWQCAYGDGYIPEEVEIRYWKKLPD